MAKRSMKSVLIEARDYISNRRNWTQGALASKRATERVPYCATGKGAKVCALGAISRALGIDEYPDDGGLPIGAKLRARLDKAAQEVAKKHGLEDELGEGLGIVELNDHNGRAKTHPLVLEAFDRAIGE